MSEEIVEGVRALVDAFNQGDVEGAVANVAANAAPDFEYVYERLRRRLREDLGTAPSPEAQELHQRLLS